MGDDQHTAETYAAKCLAIHQRVNQIRVCYSFTKLYRKTSFCGRWAMFRRRTSADSVSVGVLKDALKIFQALYWIVLLKLSLFEQVADREQFREPVGEPVRILIMRFH